MNPTQSIVFDPTFALNIFRGFLISTAVSLISVPRTIKSHFLLSRVLLCPLSGAIACFHDFTDPNIAYNSTYSISKAGYNYCRKAFEHFSDYFGFSRGAIGVFLIFLFFFRLSGFSQCQLPNQLD